MTVNDREVIFQISIEGQWIKIAGVLCFGREFCNEISEGEAGAVNEKEAQFVCVGKVFIYYLTIN